VRTGRGGAGADVIAVLFEADVWPGALHRLPYPGAAAVATAVCGAAPSTAPSSTMSVVEGARSGVSIWHSCSQLSRHRCWQQRGNSIMARVLAAAGMVPDQRRSQRWKSPQGGSAVERQRNAEAAEPALVRRVVNGCTPSPDPCSGDSRTPEFSSWSHDCGAAGLLSVTACSRAVGVVLLQLASCAKNSQHEEHRALSFSAGRTFPGGPMIVNLVSGASSFVMRSLGLSYWWSNC
jgi:hypothetical protein